MQTFLGGQYNYGIGMPDICHFWYASALFRPVKSTPKSALICDQNCLVTKQRICVLGLLVGALGVLVGVLHVFDNGIVYLSHLVFGRHEICQMFYRNYRNFQFYPKERVYRDIFVKKLRMWDVLLIYFEQIVSFFGHFYSNTK